MVLFTAFMLLVQFIYHRGTTIRVGKDQSSSRASSPADDALH
jgi:hypothetical protein